MSHVYVELQRDKDGYPPYEVEEIDAAPLGSGRFRIDGIPVFVYGLSKGDQLWRIRHKASYADCPVMPRQARCDCRVLS
jgi:hypothetical protein